jgi:hypothetical protein
MRIHEIGAIKIVRIKKPNQIYFSRVVATHLGFAFLLLFSLRDDCNKKMIANHLKFSLSLSQIILSSLSWILHVTFVEVFTVFFVIIVNPRTTIWVATQKQNS